MLRGPFRALAPRARSAVCARIVRPRSRPLSRFLENIRKEQETREQRAEWASEHDALSSPAPLREPYVEFAVDWAWRAETGQAGSWARAQRACSAIRGSGLSRWRRIDFVSEPSRALPAATRALRIRPL